MDNLVNLILLSLLFILGVTAYLLFGSKQSVLVEKEPAGFCGVVGPEYSFRDVNPSITGQIGKTLFKNNCAQCHAKNMRSSLTGPPLENLMVKWSRDTIGLQRYLNNSSEYIESETVTKRFKEMYKEFGNGTNQHSNQFSEDEVHSLLLYIER